MYWTSYITLCRLEGFIFLSNCLWLIWRIEIFGIKLLGVDKKNNEGDIWLIQGLRLRIKTTMVTDRLVTTIYRLFCDTLWRWSGAHVNPLFYFLFIFSTAIHNWRYHDSKNLNIIVVCVVLFISLCGAYQVLVCLVISCSQYDVLKLAA